MVKKKSQAKHLSHNKTHILVKKSIASYAVLVFVLFFTTALAGHALYDLALTRHNHTRLEHIQNVYTKLDLGSAYKVAKYNVFGDKRVYSWDSDRTSSSSIEYGHNDTPSNTRAELTKKIEKAGYVKVGSAYEESTSPQDYFKNADDTYIRLSVTSRYIQDNLTYGNLVDGDSLIGHKDEAPTYVTVKVNLDDNNE